ncbi:MAG TPA: hypothetical protein VHU40_02890 [Polyangia bacterium]|nr:hypothetical protein [Polyangia bacterium]
MGAGRGRSLVWAGALWAFWAVAGDRPAQGAPFNLTLEYSAPSACPGAVDFKSIVADRLGYDPFLDDRPDRVLVSLASRGGGIDGRLEWRDAAGAWAGEQTFPQVVTDCAHFARVVGFALAVQIQLLANARAAAADVTPVERRAPPVEPPQEKPTMSTPAPLIEAPVASVVAPAPVPVPVAGPTLAVGAGPALGLGLSSSPVVLGRLFGVVAWPHVSLEASAELSVPTVTRRADGAGFSQQHLLIGGAGCAVFAPVNACVVVKAGQVRMAGVDIDRPTSATAIMVEAGPRLGAGRHLGGPVWLTAHVDGLVAISRWVATLDKVAVWNAPRFAATLGIDALVRFR